MAAMIETPSRIWRRIEAIDQREMPSLPSLPAFEDSAETDQLSSDAISQSEEEDNLSDISAPIHSTPAAFSSHTATSTIRPTSSTSSTARFASSIASRSTKSSLGLSSSKGNGMSTRRSQQLDSFDISSIPSLPDMHHTAPHESDEEWELSHSKSVPDAHLPPPEDGVDGEQDVSLTEALHSVSRTSSPPYPAEPPEIEPTPKRHFEYSVSLRSEPKASPFDKFRNVAFRKPLARARTPSLTRTTPSPASSPTNSTPHSTRSIALPRSNGPSPLPGASIPLPRSTTASPAIVIHRPEDERDDRSREESISNVGQSFSLEESQRERSMDITDVHISPIHSEREHSSEDNHPYTNESGARDHENENASQETGDPTFSSDEDGRTPYAHGAISGAINNSRGDNRSPTAFSSPAPSTAFTPTPAYPRPRARFDIPSPPNGLDAAFQSQDPSNLEQDGQEEEDQTEEEPLTPHTRRRSFLLSVINSTARPRLKFPTPHPRNFAIATTPSVAESTPASTRSFDPGVGTNLQTAFAGVTPRPRKGRTSHPLAQTHIASPAVSETGTSLSPPAELKPRSRRASGSGEQWATPSQSPYDGAGDRASFISTTSSHDLTTHHRANTSFDPVMGLGAQGFGLGRFNAGKLNAYLHGLNRRLQEENEALVVRLKKMEDEKKDRVDAKRRASIGSTLGDVAEDVSAEGWIDEKAALEERVEDLEVQVKRSMREKEEVEKALEAEVEERNKDKERWRDRMGEVERGVEGIVRELERKLQEAEKRAKAVEKECQEQSRDAEKRMVELEGERDVAMERAEKAERVLESGKELGGELREANERVGNVMGDLRNANAQIKELELEVMRSDERVDELEKELKEEKQMTETLEHELKAKLDELHAERNRIQDLEQEAHQIQEELRATKAYAAELEEDAGVAVERIENLEDELASIQQKADQLAVRETQANENMEKLEGDAQRASELARQMEEALDAAEKKMWADEGELAELKGKVVTLERERVRQRDNSNMFHDPSQSHIAPGPTEADVEALEEELDGANREIARLTTLLSQSPARKAMDKAKDTKIEMLEREKDDLLERLKGLRLTVTEMATPSKLINASGISPIHRQVLAMSIRAPRTPGAPLKDMSWLNTPASTDSNVSPLISEISRLQRELDRANESIDDKLDRLEDAGLGVVGLTEKLEDARSKIVVLEDEIAKLSRREERRLSRLNRARCQKCLTKVDLTAITRPIDGDETTLDISKVNLPSEPPTPPTKTTETLRANLHSVNSQLTVMKKQWEEEKRQLLGEKAVLQDAANRLTTQIRIAKDETKRVAESERAGEKMRVGIQGELDRAKRAIADLETDLKSERARLRALMTEQDRVQRDKDGVFAQLKRTESDMDDVKRQLNMFKQENHALESELRENVNADQKARLLENKVAENIDTIDQLRQERSLLAADHKELQRRFSEISEHANRLRDEYATSQTSHANRRQQLDLHLSEIDELRRALSNQADELQRAEAEKDRIAAEKSDVARTVAALESDLRRVRKDAEAFGRDLKALRAEKERLEAKQKDESVKAERAKKQSQAHIRLLSEQLEEKRGQIAHAKEELNNHVCTADERQLAEIHLQHKKDCKGLMVQIQYLKAKFTREASFRCDLGYQKQYLLVLLSRYEKSEQTIFASIARIGFPVQPPAPSRKTRSLKSVALSVVFLLRTKGTSDLWRKQTASKETVNAALQDVRRRRIAAS